MTHGQDASATTEEPQFLLLPLLGFRLRGGGCRTPVTDLIQPDVSTIRMALVVTSALCPISVCVSTWWKMLQSSNTTGTYDLLYICCVCVSVLAFCCCCLWPPSDLDDLVVFWFDLIFFTIGNDTRRSTKWRHNTVLADTAVECLESSQQCQYYSGQQFGQRPRQGPHRSSRRQKVHAHFLLSLFL